MKIPVGLVLCALPMVMFGSGRQFLILDEDNDHYFKNPAEWMDEAHLNAYVDSLAAGGKVTHVFFCPTGGRASFDSKAWEPIWRGLEEQPKEEIFFLFRRWSENAKALSDKGIDPYQVWIRRCREKGISPWLSPRMNDAHDGAVWGRRAPYRNTTFWRTRKDLRCYPDYGKASWRHHQLDYSKQEVRENALAMIRELFERYDFDGLNLHANRWFPDETARANIPVMTAFVREIRKLADEWERRRGHKIGLSVCRAGFTPEDCRNRGFDAAAMAREGLLDIICCQPDSEPHFGDVLPVELWRGEIGMAKTAIVAGRGERLFQGRDRHDRKELDWMNFTAEMFRGWADQQLTAGADGLYLFNVEYQPQDQREICRTGLMPSDILSHPRAYPCITNCLPVRLDAPRQFVFTVGAATDGVASVVAAFAKELPGLPNATLNGVAPIGDRSMALGRACFDECRKGHETFVSVKGPARRLVFPSSAIRLGANVLSLGGVADAELRYLELRIEPESPLPKVWTSCHGLPVTNATELASALDDLKSHGVDVFEASEWWTDKDRARVLQACREKGLKLFTAVSDATRSFAQARNAELAVMIGGAYQGKAIDRHLYSFSAGKHSIVVEPPVYSVRQCYLKFPHYMMMGDGHYFGLYVPTGRAEIVVPEKLYDGTQHLRIIPAAVRRAPKGAVPENDTAAKCEKTKWIENRYLVQLDFDLSGCENCLLDKVGIAVYWHMDVFSFDFKPHRGCYSAFSGRVRGKQAQNAKDEIAAWEKADGGKFPSDVVIAARIGDEVFNHTGMLDPNGVVSLPLWGFSESGREAIEKAMKPGETYPRTFGFPEIYGPEAAARYLETYHRACAKTAKCAVDVFHEVGVKCFRNTTRGNAWYYGNDHDGTGQEMLAQVFDYLHLDPYPVRGDTYAQWGIPTDLQYMKGLSRRYGKPIINWMQAHAFGSGGLTHPSPEQIRRMYGQVKAINPEAIMWLGYNWNRKNTGSTFPW